MKLLPQGAPFWALAVSWETYPFRLLWIGFWCIAYDRSGQWYKPWPHIKILWNDDD